MTFTEMCATQRAEAIKSPQMDGVQPVASHLDTYTENSFR